MLSRWFSGGGAAGAAASAAFDVDPTHELFLLCRCSIDTKTTNVDLTLHEQQIMLMQHQEGIYNSIHSILKSYPDLVHRINPVNGYNLLQTVLSNPSLANYIPLLQLLINASEYVVEKGSDCTFDNSLNSSDSEDTMICAPFNSSQSFAVDSVLSSSPPESPKKSFGWLYRNGSSQSTSAEVISPSKIPTGTGIASKIMMMQITNEIIPSQARILRDRTFTTGANCLHVLCENISTIDRTTIKFLLQSYPASVCCYDYSNKELPFHTACSSTYQYFFSGKNTNRGVISCSIAPSSIVDSLMLLQLQYPDSCKIANQDGNLPLHLAVSSMYGGKKSSTILGSNNSTTSGSLNSSASSNHTRTKKYNNKLTSDLLCEEVVAEEGDERTDGDTASFGEVDYNAAIFCEDIDDDADDIDNIFNRCDIDTDSISVDTVEVLDDASIPTVISIRNEKPQEQNCEEKQQPKQQERKGNLLTSLSAHLPKMIKSYSNHNPTSPTASRSISTASSHRTISSDEFLDTSNEQSEIDSDGLIEVLEYLIEVYPDALYKKNQRGYTPDDLARIEYVNDPFRSHGKLQVLHYLRHAIVVAETAKINAIPRRSRHGKSSRTKLQKNYGGSSSKTMSGSTIEVLNNTSLSSSSASSTPLDRSIHDRWHNNDSTKKKKNNKIQNATRIKRDIDTFSNDNIPTNILNISDDDYIRLKL